MLLLREATFTEQDHDENMNSAMRHHTDSQLVADSRTNRFANWWSESFRLFKQRCSEQTKLLTRVGLVINVVAGTHLISTHTAHRYNLLCDVHCRAQCARCKTEIELGKMAK